jgi:hypothetical protein
MTETRNQACGPGIFGFHSRPAWKPGYKRGFPPKDNGVAPVRSDFVRNLEFWI